MYLVGRFRYWVRVSLGTCFGSQPIGITPRSGHIGSRRHTSVSADFSGTFSSGPIELAAQAPKIFRPDWRRGHPTLWLVSDVPVAHLPRSGQNGTKAGLRDLKTSDSI